MVETYASYHNKCIDDNKFCSYFIYILIYNMSISQLEVPNSYNLFANSLTLTEHIADGSKQIYWNSGSTIVSTSFIGPCNQVATYNNARAVTDNIITINKFRVLLASPAGAGQVWTFNLYVNNNPVLITASVAGNTATSATSTGNSVTLNPGDTFAINLISTPGAVSSFASICLDYQ
jgi:hypothetical protein